MVKETITPEDVHAISIACQDGRNFSTCMAETLGISVEQYKEASKGVGGPKKVAAYVNALPDRVSPTGFWLRTSSSYICDREVLVSCSPNEHQGESSLEEIIQSLIAKYGEAEPLYSQGDDPAQQTGWKFQKPAKHGQHDCLLIISVLVWSGSSQSMYGQFPFEKE